MAAGKSELQLVVSAKDEASKTLQRVSSQVKNASKAISLDAIAAVGFGLKSAASYEQSRIAFETLLGNADSARKTLKEISKFAKETPFELPEVVEGSKRLLAYGVSMDKLIPTFKVLGDIASGVGTEKMPQLITAFGQVQAKGKLMGQELLQFTEAGVNLGGALQKQFGVSREELEKMISSGKIGFPEVEKALKGLTEEGGLFYDGMNKQSKTLNGVLSNLKDSFGTTFRTLIGIDVEGNIKEGSILAIAKTQAEKLIEFLNNNQATIDNFVSSFVSTTGEVAGKIGDFTKVLWEYRDAILAVAIAYGILKGALAISGLLQGLIGLFGGLTLGVGLLTGALGLLALGGIALVVKNIYDIIKENKIWKKTHDDLSSAIHDTNTMLDGLQEKVGTLSTEKANEQLQKSIDKARELNKEADRLANLGFFGRVKEGFKSLFGKALGGSVSAGTPYVVGEHRPEVFVPSQSGNIKQMDQMGGKNITINFNNPTVRNDGDLDTIVRAVRNAINKEQEYYSIGAI